MGTPFTQDIIDRKADLALIAEAISFVDIAFAEALEVRRSLSNSYSHIADGFRVAASASADALAGSIEQEIEYAQQKLRNAQARLETDIESIEAKERRHLADEQKRIAERNRLANLGRW